MLLSCELHVSCSSLCCDVEYNVFITLLHTHTQKKKLHLLTMICISIIIPSQTMLMIVAF
jgi:hypothetical protein